MYNIEIQFEEKIPVKYGPYSYGTQRYCKFTFNVWLKYLVIQLGYKYISQQCSYALFYLQGAQGHLFQVQLTYFFILNTADKFISVFTCIIVLSVIIIKSSVQVIQSVQGRMT